MGRTEKEGNGYVSVPRDRAPFSATLCCRVYGDRCCENDATSDPFPFRLTVVNRSLHHAVLYYLAVVCVPIALAKWGAGGALSFAIFTADFYRGAGELAGFWVLLAVFAVASFASLHAVVLWVEAWVPGYKPHGFFGYIGRYLYNSWFIEHKAMFYYERGLSLCTRWCKEHNLCCMGESLLLLIAILWFGWPIILTLALRVRFSCFSFSFFFLRWGCVVQGGGWMKRRRDCDPRPSMPRTLLLDAWIVALLLSILSSSSSSRCTGRRSPPSSSLVRCFCSRFGSCGRCL